MKLNKKKVLIAAAIIIISIIFLVFIEIKSSNKDGKSTSSSRNNTGVATVVDENNIIIKSTRKNKIEKDGIVAEEIKLQILGDQLEVKTTINNNSREKLDGYLIEIVLLDENKNTVTTISDNSNDVLEAGETKEITNYVMGLENPKAIKGARISTLEKKSTQKTLEDAFDSMTPKEIQDAENGENTETTEEIEPSVVGPQLDETE